MTAVRAMFQTHPEKPGHTDIISRCIDACFECVETCTACADACLSEKQIETLASCIRLNLDCAAVCTATGSIMSRANKRGNRQPLEAQLTTCIAFCRACGSECERHATMHKHCLVCAKACRACADACTEMLSAMRMPA
ncbi:MAG: four-helix bundle copper-binding protein [Pseudorhodoplanes sp.]